MVQNACRRFPAQSLYPLDACLYLKVEVGHRVKALRKIPIIKFGESCTTCSALQIGALILIFILARRPSRCSLEGVETFSSKLTCVAFNLTSFSVIWCFCIEAGNSSKEDVDRIARGCTYKLDKGCRVGLLNFFGKDRTINGVAYIQKQTQKKTGMDQHFHIKLAQQIFVSIRKTCEELSLSPTRKSFFFFFFFVGPFGER